MNDIGEDAFKEFKTWDLGDIVEIKGFVFKTKTGEISVHAKEIRLLSKSLLPLPEKFHGLTDTDTRYRKRYLDMIMNPDVKETFIKRSKIITSIRNYLDNLGFIEVETLFLILLRAVRLQGLSSLTITRLIWICIFVLRRSFT